MRWLRRGVAWKDLRGPLGHAEDRESA